MNPTELTDREIDAAVSVKVMGWKDAAVTHCWVVREWFPKCLWRDSCLLEKDNWKPSTDHNDIAAVRAEIERLDEIESFILNLQKILPIDHFAQRWREAWLILNATPRQQCEAALKAVEGRE